MSQLRVTADHELYFAEFGNTQGIPLLYMHGGRVRAVILPKPHCSTPKAFGLFNSINAAAGNPFH